MCAHIKKHVCVFALFFINIRNTFLRLGKHFTGIVHARGNGGDIRFPLLFLGNNSVYYR